MPDQQPRAFTEVVRRIAEKVGKYREPYRERRLGEEGTKNALINPLLLALGWDIEDPDEVIFEYKHAAKDNPVDYCLRLMRETRLLVEAKGLGEDLNDTKWRNQILGYATVVGVRWCVLTDGDEYQIYNATAKVPAEQKLFCKVRISDGRVEEAVKVLSLVSRSNMSGPMLEELWKTYYADHRVKDALRELLDTPDHRIALLIRKRISDQETRWKTKEVIASIRRLDIRIDALPAPYEMKPSLGKGKGKKGDRASRHNIDVRLADLLASGYLTAPLALFRQYKGRRLEAKLLPDGKVEFEGTVYKSGSSAAEMARGSVTGRRMNTNGWVFWQYKEEGGQTLCLGDARKHFLKDKGAATGLTRTKIKQ